MKRSEAVRKGLPRTTAGHARRVRGPEYRQGLHAARRQQVPPGHRARSSARPAPRSRWTKPARSSGRARSAILRFASGRRSPDGTARLSPGRDAGAGRRADGPGRARRSRARRAGRPRSLAPAPRAAVRSRPHEPRRRHAARADADRTGRGRRSQGRHAPRGVRALDGRTGAVARTAGTRRGRGAAPGTDANAREQCARGGRGSRVARRDELHARVAAARGRRVPGAGDPAGADRTRATR